jgi:hypothetical protein
MTEAGQESNSLALLRMLECGLCAKEYQNDQSHPAGCDLTTQAKAAWVGHPFFAALSLRPSEEQRKSLYRPVRSE